MSSSAGLLHSLQKAATPAASQDPTRISMGCTGCGFDNRGGPPGYGITAICSMENMGVSENSVPPNPMVNDHYPY